MFADEPNATHPDLIRFSVLLSSGVQLDGGSVCSDREYGGASGVVPGPHADAHTNRAADRATLRLLYRVHDPVEVNPRSGQGESGRADDTQVSRDR